jgi:lysophospholipase L1-like esterase
MSVMNRPAAQESRKFAVRAAAAGVLALGALGALAGVGAVSATAAVPQALPSGCSGSSPITCHYDVSPGNYDVTVSLGSATAAGSSAMWVEARRLMLPTTNTAAGTIKQYSFTINVRQPEGEPTGEGGTGTPGLDIRFVGSSPQVSAITVKPASSPLVAYIAGDSTVCDQPTAPYTGWGQILPSWFGPGAAIANYADAGESSGSFLANSVLYPAIVSKLKAGDLVFIQFGHNDKSTTASTYRSNLTTMVNEARAKGGVPVLVTPPVRHLFNGTQLTSTAMLVNDVGVDLPAQMRSVASSLNVPLIDVTAQSAALVTSLGPTASAALYLQASVDGVTDNTHFSQYGATKIAGMVEQGIVAHNLPLASHLRSSTGGNTVTVTNPGSQSGTVGTAVSGLQVHATDSAAGVSLTYSASGLPAGLSISASGLISGTPTAAGTSTVTVTATDSTGASGTASFTWTISGGGGSSGEVHAVGAGRCLDVPGATQTNGTQLDIYDCTGGSGQLFTYTSSRQLTLYGGAKCVDAYAKGTAAGTKVDLYDCNGGTNQQWNINTNGTITGAQSGLCLDVTNAATTNGTPVELYTCNSGTNQKWTF